MAQEFEKYRLSTGYDENDYLIVFKRLLPIGRIWGFLLAAAREILQDIILPGNTIEDQPLPHTPQIQDGLDGEAENIGSVHLLGKLLSCFAAEVARLDVRVYDVFAEAIPGLSVELLPDHEKQLGLPDVCSISLEPLPLEERQRAAHAKQYDEYETQTKSYWEKYAATLGFTVTASDSTHSNLPRIYGVGIMGDSVLGGWDLNGLITITIHAGTGNLDYMKCVFINVKPAHTIFEFIDERGP